MSGTPSSWRRRFVEGFRHAFGVEGPTAAIPTEDEREVIERILAGVVRRRLTGPTLLLLESSRSLNALSAGALHLLTPIAGAIVDRSALDIFARYLERRGSVEWICGRLEAMEGDARSNGAEPNAPPSAGVGDAERADL